MICIVNKNTNVIVKTYNSQVPILNISGNNYSNTDSYMHLVAPEGLKSDEVLLQNNQIVADLDSIRLKQEVSIRNQRNDLLKKTDSKWIEYFTKNLDKSGIESDKHILRNFMTLVKSNLATMTDIQDIKKYDPISTLNLSMNYEN